MADDIALLAVDLGLRTGLAAYGRDGKLRWQRSQNYGSRARLKRDAYSLLREHAALETLVVEGGGDLAVVWEREADRRGVRLRRIGAEAWRRDLLYAREQRHGKDAKAAADGLAREIIAWSGLRLPKRLKHDAAEAILIGLWGVLQEGWLKAVPQPIRR